MKDTPDALSSGYAEILDRVAQRAASAVVAKGRVRSVVLRRALSERLRTAPGGDDAFLADPVFEAARVWQRAGKTLDDLEGELLEEDLVAALESAGWSRTAAEAAPYLHQLNAWEAAEAGKSFLVTSGTGSGKTECFMVPILNDLLRQSPRVRRRGVQAIILYPLNALIDSQRERLGEWVAPLASRLTYALYNRHLKETLPRREWPGGGQVPDRKHLREDPPSILVTNTTMLEYMLMRAQDGPILEQSQGTLRWIILDEAHSYVGAQAAEMALLLRRVRQAFGVAPEDVRLAATSATIGEGPEVTETLRQFVADLGGVSTERVEVISGEEREPRLPPVGEDAPLAGSAQEDGEEGLWKRLAPHPRIQQARKRMRENGLTAGEAVETLGLGRRDDPQARHDAFSLLEAAARAQDPNSGLRLAPWRLHVFHRAQAGLWACADPACSVRDPVLAAEETDWPFGQVYTESRERCDCSAPIFEVGACDECGTPWLFAERHAKGGHEFLGQVRRIDDEDEYVLDVEPEPDQEDDEKPTSTPSASVLLGPGSDGSGILVRLTDGAVLNQASAEDRVACLDMLDDPRARGCCARSHEARTTVRPQRFGAPFLMGNAMPTLLEAVPRLDNAQGVPFGGRRLLSFTDSRQGSARFSAKLQQEAERTLTRAVIYHAVQQDGATDPERIAKLEAEISALQQVAATMPALRTTLDAKQHDLKTLTDGASRIAWPDLRRTLAENPELYAFATEVWRGRPAGGDHLAEHPGDLAELFLFRELFRRPRMQNNVETMGLARLVFPALEERARLHVPQELREVGHDSVVWSDVLHAALDILFRANLAIDLPSDPVDMRHWISPRSALSAVLEPGTPPDAEAPVRTPRRFPKATSTRSNLVRLLFRLTGGTPDSSADSERVEAVLAAIWEAIKGARLLKSAGPHAWRLDLRKAAVARLDRAWQCPQTWRLLPYAPASVSLNAVGADAAVSIEMPRLPAAAVMGLTSGQRSDIRQRLRTDPLVAGLRERGHWTDLSDRVAEFSPFLRAQEHSAQIDRPSLETYEAAFSQGRINILNCSTTMEMGVDIPDVGLVINTNVPPAPANYRQRVGRAGRRGEPWALSFTFCKDLPLDRMIFREPARLLQGEVRAPAVRLDSAVLVQRHINAALLGMYLRREGGIRVTTQIGTFFGAQKEPDAPWLPDSPAENFVVAIQGDWGASEEVAEALGLVVRGTALEGNQGLVLRVEHAFEQMRRHWMAEYEQLLIAQSAYPESDPAHGFYAKRARRMREEFMMSELARRGFTPAYGFPVDVVSFDHVGRDAAEGGPSRSLDLAIRDYSPGSEVVIDGLVHRSDGVLPTWGNRSDPGAVEDLRTLWRCPECNAFGTARMAVESCPSCDATTRQGELLRPSGFLGTSRPHSAYEALDYVAPDKSRVTAGPAPWVSLPDPRTGALRTSREGRVLVTASGPNDAGYALCITCGRAEAEHREGDQALPPGMRNHRPLQRPKDNPRADGLCPGNDIGARKIRRNVRLGTEMTTDVFELRFDALKATDVGLGHAMAIGAALREALAAQLGVDAEQMGVTVAPSTRTDGGRRASLFLYDKTSGGSGFAIAAETDLPALLTAAARRLDCNADCGHGCPECILRRDLQFDMGPVERAGALEILREAILPHLALPEELQVFGPQTGAITEPISDWIRRQIAGTRLSRLALFLHGDAQGWDVMDWSGPDLLAAAQRGGAEVMFVLPISEVPKLDFAQKLDLVRAASRAGASLNTTREMPTAADRPIVTGVGIDGRTLHIAVSSPGAERIGAEWGDVSTGPGLTGTGELPEIGPALSLAKLAAFGEGNSAHTEVRHEFDGPLANFGRAFWKIVTPLRPQAFAGKRLVARATYSDRYLRSPLTARLLHEIVRTMPGRYNDTVVEVVTERASGRQPAPVRALHESWTDDAIRSAVLQGLLPGAEVSLRPKHECPHARSLCLYFVDGVSVTIFLDQGLGAWRTAALRPVAFDGGADPARQVEDLRRVATDIKIQGRGQHPSPIWVTW